MGLTNCPISYGSNTLHMYTQHPDRLVPFSVVALQRNELMNFMLSSMTFPMMPSAIVSHYYPKTLWTSSKTSQILKEGEGKVDAGTEAEFVAYRRTEDIKTVDFGYSQ